MVQLNLKFMHVCGQTCAHTHSIQEKYKLWCISSLLHVDLSYTLLRVNTNAILYYVHIHLGPLFPLITFVVNMMELPTNYITE